MRAPAIVVTTVCRGCWIWIDEAGAVKGNAAGPLSDSFGLSVSAGLNYDIDDNFMANVGVWYMDIDTELEAAKETVEIDPLVVMAGIGYQF